MFPLNLLPADVPVGLTTGKFTPYATLTDSRVMDSDLWSDGSSGTHGLLYPTNYASTEQTLINTNITALKGVSALDNNSYTTGATKKKILGNYFNNYRSIARAGFYGDEIVSNGSTINAATGDRDICEIATDKVVTVYVDTADSSKLKCIVSTLTNLGTWSHGSPTTLDATASAVSPIVIKMATDKFVVGYYIANTMKAVVATVSGTTVTAGSPANASTNSNEIAGLCKIGTDKFAFAFIDNTSSDPEAIVATCTGTTTITYGSKVALFAGTCDPLVGGGSGSTGRNTMCALDTDKFVLFVSSGSQPQYVACSVAGTVITAGTADVLTNATFNFNSRFEVVQLTTDKVLVYGGSATANNAMVITFSGLVNTAGTAFALTASTSIISRHLVVINSGKVLAITTGTFSSVTGIFAQEIYIDGRTGVAGPQVTIQVTALSVKNFIQTTNYTVCLLDNSTITGYAERHLSVTVTVNGTAFATTQSIPLYGFVGTPVNTYGRKAYMTIQNNNSFTQDIVMGTVFANVD